MNTISEKNFQLVVKYGPYVLGVCLLLNIWLVLRYREVYRDAVKAEVQLEYTMTGQRMLEGLLQDFSTHANSDPHIAQILREAQSPNAAAGAAAGQPVQH